MKNCFHVCLFIALFLPLSVCAQRVHVLKTDTGNTPEITSELYVYDKDWDVQTGLSTASFRVFENGAERPVLRYVCQPSPQPIPQSAVLTIDVSASMDFPVDSAMSPRVDPFMPRIDIARRVAELWVEEWPSGWECALTAFNAKSFLLRDFTTDKSKLRQSITALTTAGGTDYRQALLDELTGSLSVASRASQKPVIVFLTDGVSLPPLRNEAEVISKALAMKATIYCVCLGMTAPPELKNIAKSTGGVCYDAILNEEEMLMVFRNIINTTLGIKPCKLTWSTELNCEPTHAVEIAAPAYSTSATLSYTLQRPQLPHLVATPLGVDFGFIPPGKTLDTVITIKAEHAPATITRITCSSVAFRVEDVSLPLVLAAGQQHKLKVTFAPVDSAHTYADITLEGTACHGNVIPVSGGFPGIISAVPTLQLIYPNGGEILSVGTIATITWKGTFPTDTLTLEYSTNEGRTWKPITNKATNFAYEWYVPNTPSTTCLMRAIFDPSPNTNAKSDTTLLYHDHSVSSVDFKADTLIASSDDMGFIKCINKPEASLATTMKTWCVRFSPDNKLLVVGTGNQAEIWDRETATRLHVLSHTLPVYTVEFDPSGRRVLTASGDKTSKLWNTDTGDELFTLDAETNAGITRCACFDASGNRVYTGQENGTYEVWNAIAGNRQNIFPAHSEMIYAIDNNPINSNIATGSRDGTVKLINGTTGDIIATFPSDGGEVHSVAFNPTGQLLAGGCEDGTVKIWDVNKRKLVLTLLAHVDVVTGLSFAPDGIHLATASYDSTVKIWDVGYRGLMTDSSDALWTIAVPAIKARDIDFGEVYVGTSKDTTLHDFFINEGIVAAYIDSVRITGTGKNTFTSDISLDGFGLPAKDHRRADFRFTPIAVGSYDANLIVYYHGMSSKYKLLGRGIKPLVEVVRKEINFGRVRVNTSKDTTDIVLRNISTLPVTIASVGIAPLNADLFSVRAATAPFVLPPNGEYTVSLRFSPVEIGSVSGLLVITCASIPTPISIPLFGTGISESLVELGPPVEFAITCLRQTTSQTIVVSNPLQTAITITQLRIEGVNASDFSTVGAPAVPFTIATGATRTITILCEPDGTGVRNASLVLEARHSTGKATLVQRLHAVRDTLDFRLSTPLVQMNELRELEAKRDSIGVFNSGTIPLVFAAPYSISGFTVDSIVPNPILPDGAGFIYVHYKGGTQGTVENQQFTGAQGDCGTVAVQLKAAVQKWPSILASAAAVDSLAFAPLVCTGAQRDTTVELVNTGPTPITITGVNLSGVHAGDFSLTIPSDLTLDPQESAAIGVRFTPSLTGIRTAAIVFTTSVNDSVCTLPLRGAFSQPSFSVQSEVNMAAVRTNTSTTAVVVLHNTGDAPMTWTLPAANGQFSVLSIEPPTAQPGDSSIVTIVFSGMPDAGDYEGTLLFVHPCGEDAGVRVRIQVGDIPYATAWVGEASGSPGDAIAVPVYVEAPASLRERGITHFTTTLSFNASLLVPAGATPNGTVAGNVRSIPLVIPVDAGTPALVLRFGAALGNDSTTALHLDSVVAVGGTVQTASKDGVFTLTGFCREGGIRLFDGASAAGLSTPAPSPAGGETRIVYSIVEKGGTSIEIVDLLGRVATSLFDGVATPGVYELAVPTTTLPPGAYFVVMRTPTQVFTQRLDIAR